MVFKKVRLAYILLKTNTRSWPSCIRHVCSIPFRNMFWHSLFSLSPPTVLTIPLNCSFWIEFHPSSKGACLLLRNHVFSLIFFPLSPECAQASRVQSGCGGSSLLWFWDRLNFLIHSVLFKWLIFLWRFQRHQTCRWTPFKGIYSRCVRFSIPRPNMSVVWFDVLPYCKCFPEGLLGGVSVPMTGINTSSNYLGKSVLVNDGWTVQQLFVVG